MLKIGIISKIDKYKPLIKLYSIKGTLILKKPSNNSQKPKVAESGRAPSMLSYTPPPGGLFA